MPVTTSDGRVLWLPQADVVVNAQNLVSVSLAPGGIVAMIGTADAGEPDVVNQLDSSSLASSIYRGGDLLDSLQAAWANGAQTQLAVRIGSPVQSMVTLQDSASGDVLELKAIDSGEYTNNYQYKVESGSTSGYKVTVQFFDSNTSNTVTEIADNVANAGEVVDYFNLNSTLVTSTLIGASGSDLMSPISYTNFTQGSNGPSPTYTQWTNALALLEAYNVNWVYVTSTDSAVHALVQTHVESLSKKRGERMGVVGAPAGTAIGNPNNKGAIPTSYLNRAVTMNSYRMVLVSPGTDGRSGAYTAAKIVGKLSSLDAATPLTFKTVNASSLEYKYLQQQLIDLMQGGVTVLQELSSGRRVVRGVTTVQDSVADGVVTESPYKEISIVTVRDSIARNLRGVLETTYIGKKGLAGIESQIGNTMASVLTSLVDQQLIVNFRNIQVRRNPLVPTAFSASVQVAPALPINFILVNVDLTV